MKIFLSLIILIFSLQSWTKADDIGEFELEGISIGDSALKFFKEEAIKNNTWDYPDKKYKRVQNDNYDFFKTYDAIDFHYKSNDKKYIIHSLSGILIYEKNIEKCYKKMDEIVSDIENVFSDKVLMSEKSTFPHPSPKNTDGKSKVTVITFEFPGGDEIDVACYDYSEAHGSQDHLNLNISTKIFSDWMRNDAYK